MPRQQNILRTISILIGISILILGIGFGLNLPWVTGTWPWPDGPLSHLFVGSILASVSVAYIWIGFTAEWGALAAGALTSLVMTTGQAVYLLLLASRPDRQGLLPWAAWFAGVALFSLGLLLWSRRIPIRDTRPMPRLLRISYVIFVVVLFLASSALILGQQIFPWKLNADSGVMFGWIFMGDACYFLYSLRNPRWHNARSQLLSFLAYDLFLIPPFLGLWAVQTTNFRSLPIYLVVLFYSGLLAVYYLFLDPVTRPWAVQAPESPRSPSR